MSNLKSNTKNIIVGEKVNNTKVIIIALLKSDLNLPNIKPPNETTALIDIFDTSPNNKTNRGRVCSR